MLLAFDNLVGQTELHKTLLTELRSGTVSPATLFTGPQGSGKKTWGLAFAQALLCRAGGEAACGNCLSCRQLVSGNHPQFFFLKPAAGRRLRIDQIRQAKPQFYIVGPGNERRVCLIAEADRMTPEAGSSLLKLLEEPPNNLFIILTASNPEKLLGTIVSRCRCYKLRLLSRGEIIRFLRGVPDLPKVDLDLIARLSRGLPGAAVALARDAELGNRIRLSVELVEMSAAPSVNDFVLFHQASSLAEREDLLPLLELMFIHYRDALIRSLCGEPDPDLLIFPDYPGPAVETSAEILKQCLAIVDRAIRSIAFTNVHKQLALEAMIILLQRRFAGA